jgi:hypothetical protein
VEFLCYTLNVEEKYKLWHIWSGSLQRWGIGELAANLLEFSAPLNIILAQFVYFGEPFLPPTGSQSNLKALGEMLADDSETRAFVTLLREGMVT